MHEKIQPHHTQRKAILYVRQSSSYQVDHNHESRLLQYAVQERLRDFGWRDVDVIDEDLGRSASGAVERSGFDRMVGGSGTARFRSGTAPPPVAVKLTWCRWGRNVPSAQSGNFSTE